MNAYLVTISRSNLVVLSTQVRRSNDEIQVEIRVIVLLELDRVYTELLHLVRFRELLLQVVQADPLCVAMLMLDRRVMKATYRINYEPGMCWAAA